MDLETNIIICALNKEIKYSFCSILLYFALIIGNNLWLNICSDLRFLCRVLDHWRWAGSFVFPQQIFPDESFSTHSAGIWFNIWMSEHVLYVVVFVLETPPTIVTLESWGRTVVSGLHVTIQWGVPPKSLFAQITGVFRSKVSLLVLFQLLVIAEASRTILPQ